MIVQISQQITAENSKHRLPTPESPFFSSEISCAGHATHSSYRGVIRAIESRCHLGRSVTSARINLKYLLTDFSLPYCLANA